MTRNNQVGRRSPPEMDDAERERQAIGQGGKLSTVGDNTKHVADDPEPAGRRGGQASGGGKGSGMNRSDAQDSGSAKSSSAQTGKKSRQGGSPQR
jgi:hypothetical protein